MYGRFLNKTRGPNAIQSKTHWAFCIWMWKKQKCPGLFSFQVKTHEAFDMGAGQAGRPGWPTRFGLLAWLAYLTCLACLPGLSLPRLPAWTVACPPAWPACLACLPCLQASEARGGALNIPPPREGRYVEHTNPKGVPPKVGLLNNPLPDPQLT